MNYKNIAIELDRRCKVLIQLLDTIGKAEHFDYPNSSIEVEKWYKNLERFFEKEKILKAFEKYLKPKASGATSAESYITWVRNAYLKPLEHLIYKYNLPLEPPWREKMRTRLEFLETESLNMHSRLLDDLNSRVYLPPKVLKTKIEVFIRELKNFLESEGLETKAEILKNIQLDSEDSKDYISFISRVLTPFINKLILEIERFPGEISRESKNKDTKATPKGNKVFIVHGHDETNLYKLKDLLKDRYKLECIIMKFQAGKGRTLIEKFEQEAGDAGFAFILMTPDDLVEIPGKKEQYAQARPNVIFELGWFHGKLGRNRVCILFKKGTQIHSDLAGVSRIEFNESVEEKVLEIEQELRAAGLIQ